MGLSWAYFRCGSGPEDWKRRVSWGPPSLRFLLWFFFSPLSQAVPPWWVCSAAVHAAVKPLVLFTSVPLFSPIFRSCGPPFLFFGPSFPHHNSRRAWQKESAHLAKVRILFFTYPPLKPPPTNPLLPFRLVQIGSQVRPVLKPAWQAGPTHLPRSLLLCEFSFFTLPPSVSFFSSPVSLPK